MALTKASRGAATRGLHAGMYRPSGAKGPFLLPDQGLTPLAIPFRRSAANKSTAREPGGVVFYTRATVTLRSNALKSITVNNPG